MRQRLPLILSATALAVALLGSTPLGHAAAKLVQTVPPFAKQAGFAKYAGTADNARRLAGHKASVTPVAGDIPVLGTDGKLPPSLGTVGPQGPKGDKGDKATSLWVVASSDGSVIASKGVSAVVHPYKGGYRVTFNRDVSKCAFSAAPRAVENIIADALPFSGDPKVAQVGMWVIGDKVDSYDSDFSLAEIRTLRARAHRHEHHDQSDQRGTHSAGVAGGAPCEQV